MAALLAKNLFFFVPNRLCFLRRCCFFFNSNSSLSMSSPNHASIARASPSSLSFSETISDHPSETNMVGEDTNSVMKILACSICYGPLTPMTDSGLSIDSTGGYQLQCSTCRKSFIGTETHLDLTISGGVENSTVMPATTELFRTRLVSFLYERGWRQSFSMVLGFPGPKEEFELIKTFITPVLGGNIIDASCGSGMFSRIFAKSGLFSSVVALDYSENMLKECYEFIKQEENFPKENLTLVRADISRLPFASSSIDAVHAGAALHCWPSPSAGVAEISRILRPGGVFVASTFILDGPYSFIPFLGTQRERAKQIFGSHNFLSESELEELCAGCGLVNFRCLRNRRFVLISVTKPT